MEQHPTPAQKALSQDMMPARSRSPRLRGVNKIKNGGSDHTVGSSKNVGDY
jgi:hypothetical protein